MRPHANGKAAKSDQIGDELAKHRRGQRMSQPDHVGDHVLDLPEAQNFSPEELAQIAEFEGSAPAMNGAGYPHFETPFQPSSESLPLLYYADISPSLDAADFVEGLFIDGAMSVIYGESGCGKTFFALDRALHVAAGIPWRGREVDRGGVLYLALEGSHGIRNRVAAFKAANCAGDADLPFAVVPVSVNLLDPNADTENVIAAAKAAYRSS